MPHNRKRTRLYVIIFIALAIISVLPLYAEKPFPPEKTQDVIFSLLMVSLKPYEPLGPIFHVITLALILLIAWRPGKAVGRVLAAYMGLNYLVIGLLQTMGTTEKYGFVVQTGALVACVILGITWGVVAIRGDLEASFKGVPWPRYLGLPLALLAFWSPWAITDGVAHAYFNPLLLLTSPEYGLAYCMATPVFVFLLILFYPRFNIFAYRITAFNGLLYGLFNLTHWFNPAWRWMGVLHLPLLILSLAALFLPKLARANTVPVTH